MASPPDTDGFSDVRKVGYLRKPKSMHKRFFVLRAASEAGGPARLEYYENEKKWRHKSSAPKRSIPLESCFNINKRADSKNKHLVALYTRDEHFAIAADSEAEQDSWYQALLQLHNRAKGHHHDGAVASGVGGGGGGGSCSGGSSGLGEAGEDLSYGDVPPGPAFKEVWQVILKPKGLGQTKNLIGIYRLCLTSKTISFVKLNSEAAAVVLQLMNIRRCGHSENFFFIEVGRSAVTGPGEFWMQVDDSVVAQNMHETILEAMRAMSDEFRPRSKSQSSSNCSNPISVPLRRHHLNNPPPSQVGLTRRSRTESITATSPASLVGGKQGSFRVRASSDGEGTMSRPASVDGSPVSPSTTRTHAHRHRGSSRLHPPLNHSRSIPMPSSRCSPSATSPVSLSSSSTSGHGSTSDCLFPRRSSASVSGSPSDGGFISSDEYGSSPCDFRSSFRSVTPDSLGHTPPARGEEELSNYICMGGKGAATLAAPNGHYILPRGGNGHRYVPGAGLGLSPALAGEEAATAADLENRFRKRTHSAGTSPTISHQKTPSQSSVASIEEYTEMMPAYPPGGGSGGRLPGYRHSAFVPTHSYPEEGLEMHPLERRGGHHHHRSDASALHTDDGYMPMSPGVAPVPSGSRKGSEDYMPMSPKSVSAPQQIINPVRRHPQRVDPNGYMMMSPSGSCSPDIGGGPGGGGNSTTQSGSTYGKMWTNGVGGHHSHALPHPKLPSESRGGGGKLLPCTGDYMNMSPVGDSNTSSPSDCYYGPEDPQHKSVLSYYSLPRSFKHTQRPGELEEPPRHQHLRLSSSSGRLLYAAAAADDSSSSTSSDSLGGGYCGGRPEPGLPHLHHQVLQPHLPRKVDTAAQTNSRLTRPTRLSLGDPKASTLPRAREQPPPPQPPSLGHYPPEPKSPGEYVNIDFGSEQPGYLSCPVASHSSPAVKCPAQLQLASRQEETGTEEYMNMDLGPGRRVAWEDSPRGPPGRGVPAPPGAPSLCRPQRAVPGGRGDYMTMQMGCPRQSYVDISPVAPVSYADMRTGLAEEASLPGATADTPCSSSAASTSPTAPPGGSSSLLGAPQGPGSVSAFTRVNLSPNHNQSAKVIRADPLGCRRRHSSETFSSTPSATRAGNAVPFGAGAAMGASGGGSSSKEDMKRHSSASFENVWLRPGELGGAPKEPAPVCGGPGGVENGLNYIDLDLVKDFKQRPQERPPQLRPPAPPSPRQPLGSSESGSASRSSEDLSAYASISFQKQPDDLQ
ncbi:insulin receptor substrate 1 [Erinaceus europaeus]|uniref:Insulin receptor substrate 1 n=1 Tax=Erinaceus europaeus TaxID=9365 RepID=A0A1S2ZJ46_ERIEU|nr:insulin receptor substrate 1 [Erinaceus europaeus]